MAKILIMDDEPGLRNIVHNMLKPLGLAIVTAEDGKQAIEKARAENPELAMLDMRVPDMDGLAVLAELKKINPDIRCIMLSGFGDVETAAEASKQGAFDYISKPFKIEEVLGSVNRALSSLGRPPAAPAVPVEAPAGAAASAKKTVAAARRPVGVIVGAAIGLAVLVFVVLHFFGGTAKGKSFVVPYAHPTGLGFFRSHLWVTDEVSGTVYQHADDGALSVTASFTTQNTQPSGITYDGENIWTCSSHEKKIYRHALDGSLTVNAVFVTTNTTPSSVYFDGAFLLVTDFETGRISRHRTDATLSDVGVFASPAANPVGMFKGRECYFIGDRASGNIFKVSAADFSAVDAYALPDFANPDSRLGGVAGDGSTVWATAAGTGKIFKYRMNSLKRVRRD